MVAAHQEWLAADRWFGLPPMDASGVLIPVFGFEAFCDEAIALRAVAIPHVGELKADHAARQEQDRDAVVVDNEARRLTVFANPGAMGGSLITAPAWISPPPTAAARSIR